MHTQPLKYYEKDLANKKQNLKGLGDKNFRSQP